VTGSLQVLTILGLKVGRALGRSRLSLAGAYTPEKRLFALEYVQLDPKNRSEHTLASLPLPASPASDRAIRTERNGCL
jgi:hypothetical protein